MLVIHSYSNKKSYALILIPQVKCMSAKLKKRRRYESGKIHRFFVPSVYAFLLINIFKII